MSQNNIAEILLEQGKYGEAEPLLTEALRTWRGSGYRIGVALAHANLGRLMARTGRSDQAREHLDQAEQDFSEIGAESFVIESLIRKAENALLSGNLDVAVAIADDALVRTSELTGAETQRAALHRMRGCARLATGDDSGARTELDASLAEARAASADHEVGLTLEALTRWAAIAGFEADEWVRERDEIFARLGITKAPPVPVGT